MKPPQPVVLEGEHVRLEPLGPQHRGDLEAAAAEDTEIFRYMGMNIPMHGWDAWLAEAQEGVRSRPLRGLGDDRPRVAAGRSAPRASATSRPRTGAWRSAGPGSRPRTSGPRRTPRPSSFSWATRSTSWAPRVWRSRPMPATCAPRRPSSGIGGVREGVLRRHLRVADGFIRDTVYYSILDDEWPEVKARLTERLTRGRHAGPDRVDR